MKDVKITFSDPLGFNQQISIDAGDYDVRSITHEEQSYLYNFLESYDEEILLRYANIEEGLKMYIKFNLDSEDIATYKEREIILGILARVTRKELNIIITNNVVEYVLTTKYRGSVTACPCPVDQDEKLQVA